MRQLGQHQIAAGTWYINHPDHRNNLGNKSQWRISEDEERTVFSITWNRGWAANCLGWGAHFPNGAAEYLGVAQDHATPVFIAKFVDSSATGIWHGYPVDHSRNFPGNVPDLDILNQWMADGIISTAKRRRIQKGQRCRL